MPRIVCKAMCKCARHGADCGQDCRGRARCKKTVAVGTTSDYCSVHKDYTVALAQVKEDECTEECVVCLKGVKKGSRNRTVTECGHEFHKTCLGNWIWRKTTEAADAKKQVAVTVSCPICRGALAHEWMRVVYGSALVDTIDMVNERVNRPLRLKLFGGAGALDVDYRGIAFDELDMLLELQATVDEMIHSITSWQQTRAWSMGAMNADSVAALQRMLIHLYGRPPITTMP